MKKIFMALMLCMLAVGVSGSTASAQEMMKADMKKNGNPTVGGAAMYKTELGRTRLVADSHDARKAVSPPDCALSKARAFQRFAPTTILSPKSDTRPDLLMQPENQATLPRF